MKSCGCVCLGRARTCRKNFDIRLCWSLKKGCLILLTSYIWNSWGVKWILLGFKWFFKVVLYGFVHEKRDGSFGCLRSVWTSWKQVYGSPNWHVGLLMKEDRLCVAWGSHIQILEDMTVMWQWSVATLSLARQDRSQCFGLGLKMCFDFVGNKQDRSQLSSKTCW
jgi:hypothetical protein